MSAAREGRRETDLREWRTGEGKVLGAKIPPPQGGHLSAAVPPGLGDERPLREPGLSGRFWTLPNAISLGRIALIPVLVVAILGWDDPVLALWILGVVVVSDWLDGKIARLWDMRSIWGERLDPIADRILVAVVPVTFVIAGYIPVWVVVVLLARDALLLVTHNALQAKLMGSQLGLHPITALVSLYTGWKLGGLWGMLLLPVCCVVVCSLNDAGILKLYR